MRVILQTKDHRQFLDAANQWTTHMDAAQKFTNGADALRHSVDCNLLDAEILYEFEDPHLSFAVPVSEIESAVLAQGFTRG